METKVCGACKLTLMLDDFYKTKEGKISGKNCKACNRLRVKKYKLENRELVRESRKIYNDNNKDKKARYDKIYRQNNLEKIKLRDLRYRKNNPKKISELNKKYRNKYPHVPRLIEAKRRAYKKNAVPKWVNSDEWKQIKELYSEAKRLEAETGEPFHIDHVIPLVHPLVCGFHCISNLRVVPAKVNLAKGNKFEPFVESEIDITNLKPWEIL